MKRCLFPLLMALALPATVNAQAVTRIFPKDTFRGEMTVKQPPYIEMDDRVTRLTPGARLLDENNRQVMSSSLLNRAVTVNYTVDRRGQVTRAWIVTAEEKKEKRPGYGVERNFSFESDQAAQGARTLPARPASPN